MDIPKLTHTMDGQIIGKIEFNEPFQFTFVYSDNRRTIFDNIVRLVTMKTGCYCLFDNKETCFVVRPLHEYVIERPQTVHQNN